MSFYRFYSIFKNAKRWLGAFNTQRGWLRGLPRELKLKPFVFILHVTMKIDHVTLNIHLHPQLTPLYSPRHHYRIICGETSGHLVSTCIYCLYCYCTNILWCFVWSTVSSETIMYSYILLFIKLLFFVPGGKFDYLSRHDYISNHSLAQGVRKRGCLVYLDL